MLAYLALELGAPLGLAAATAAVAGLCDVRRIWDQALRSGQPCTGSGAGAADRAAVVLVQARWFATTWPAHLRRVGSRGGVYRLATDRWYRLVYWPRISNRLRV